MVLLVWSFIRFWTWGLIDISHTDCKDSCNWVGEWQKHMFIKCSCCRRERYGLPCVHYHCLMWNFDLEIENYLSLEMFDVRVLKLFNANYGDKSDLGTTLNLAQNDCFRFEGFGTRINNNMYYYLLCTNSIQQTFPKSVLQHTRCYPQTRQAKQQTPRTIQQTTNTIFNTFSTTHLGLYSISASKRSTWKASERLAKSCGDVVGNVVGMLLTLRLLGFLLLQIPHS